MENNNKNEVNENLKVKKTLKKEITINDVIVYVDAEDTEEDYDNIKTIEELIVLSNKKPNVILGFKPSLYSTFKSKTTKCIETYVNKGDTVTYRSPVLAPDKKNVVVDVEEIGLKSLGSMSIVYAKLTNGDTCLTTHLIKV